jgi:micrococcal nuclease
MKLFTHLHKKVAQLLLSLFITIFLVSCNPNDSTSSGKKAPDAQIQPNTVQQSENRIAPQKKDLQTAEVIRVIDGDTFRVRINGKNERVRLTLIDTPEINSQSKEKPQPYAIEAKNFLADLVEGKTVELERDVEEKDRYKRYLFYVYVDGKSVQEELIRHGYARVAKFPPNVKYFTQYRKLEEQAKQEKLRIWSLDHYVTDRGFDSRVVND